jgi:hypothetical protein
MLVPRNGCVALAHSADTRLALRFYRPNRRQPCRALAALDTGGVSIRQLEMSVSARSQGKLVAACDLRRARHYSWVYSYILALGIF